MLSSFELFTKSRIPALFKRYAPHLDSSLYRAAAEVFPMRANSYVLENHIDWRNVPHDPMFQLVFPQPEMLESMDLINIDRELKRPDRSRPRLRTQVEAIRGKLNPHPAGQREENVPILENRKMGGMQHKYRETLLFFPMEGQFCHSFCTYCFRWAQFTSVGSDQQFKSGSPASLVVYLARHHCIQDVLFTGGDPMVMSTHNVEKYIRPLLEDPRLRHLSSIRIGTKSLAFWPFRYISDGDAPELLRLFTDVVKSGKHLTLQAHFSHFQELETPAVQEAIRLIRMTGANIRCQSPLIRHVNDDPKVWAKMWSEQVRLGAIPYYMFVERDTGASRYFSVPLERAYCIFMLAFSQTSGLARTVRGPSMSASPGKVIIVGIEEVAGERVFVMKFTQARNPAWNRKVFFASFDPRATWLSDLRPAFGARSFFFEDEYRHIRERGESSGQITFES